MDALPAWAHLLVCLVAPPLWGVLAARIYRRRDRLRRAAPVDYAI